MSNRPKTPQLNSGYTYRQQIQPKHLRYKTVLAMLAACYTHSSYQTWQQRLALGQIALSGCTLRQDIPLQTGQTSQLGQWLEWQRPPWYEPSVPLDFAVCYQDNELLAVDKPSGLPTMPAGGFLQHTLLHQVRQTWPTARPLHRLGRGTTGLVLFALTAASAAAVANDWRRQQVRKVYLALASGQLGQLEQLNSVGQVFLASDYDRNFDSGITGAREFGICTPIGPVWHPKLGQLFAANWQGKPARSDLSLIWARSDLSLCRLQIHTGRPHQIRIHLASVGYPLLGDPLYGVGGLPLADLAALPSDLGYFLQSASLSLRHPSSGQWLELRATRPAWASVPP